jgi:antitoxin VapB
MALNIKDPETEKLAAEVASMTGESKTRAIRRALEERKERLAYQIAPRERIHDLFGLLEREVWPSVPAGVLGKRLTREQEEAILGYGPTGA